MKIKATFIGESEIFITDKEYELLLSDMNEERFPQEYIGKATIVRHHHGISVIYMAKDSNLKNPREVSLPYTRIIDFLKDWKDIEVIGDKS